MSTASNISIYLQDARARRERVMDLSMQDSTMRTKQRHGDALHSRNAEDSISDRHSISSDGYSHSLKSNGTSRIVSREDSRDGFDREYISYEEQIQVVWSSLMDLLQKRCDGNAHTTENSEQIGLLHGHDSFQHLTNSLHLNIFHAVHELKGLLERQKALLHNHLYTQAEQIRSMYAADFSSHQSEHQETIHRLEEENANLRRVIESLNSVHSTSSENLETSLSTHDTKRNMQQEIFSLQQQNLKLSRALADDASIIQRLDDRIRIVERSSAWTDTSISKRDLPSLYSIQQQLLQVISDAQSTQSNRLSTESQHSSGKIDFQYTKPSLEHIYAQLLQITQKVAGSSISEKSWRDDEGDEKRSTLSSQSKVALLESEVASASQVIKDLKVEISKLQQLNSELRSREESHLKAIEELEKSNAVWKTEIDKLRDSLLKFELKSMDTKSASTHQDEKNVLRTQIAELQQSVVSYEEKLLYAQNLISQHERSYQYEQERAIDLESKLASLTKQRIPQEGSLRSIDVAIVHSSRGHNQIDRQIDDLSLDLKRTEAALRALQNDHQQVCDRAMQSELHANQMADRLALLQMELRDKEAELHRVNQSLKQNLSKSHAMCDDLNRQVAELQSEIRVLQSSQSELRQSAQLEGTEAAALKTQIRLIVQQLESCMESNDALKTRVEDDATKLQEIKAKLKAAMTAKLVIADRLRSLHNNILQITGSEAIVMNTIGDRQEDQEVLEDCHTFCHQIETAIRNYASSQEVLIGGLKQARIELLKKTNIMSSEVDVANRRADEADSARKLLLRQLSDLSEEKERLLRSYQLAKDDFLSLEQKFIQTVKDYASTSAGNLPKQREFAELLNEVDALRESKRRLEARFEKSESDYRDLKATFDTELGSLQDQHSQVLHSMQADAQDLQRKVLALTEELRRAHQEIETMKLRRSDFENRIPESSLGMSLSRTISLESRSPRPSESSHKSLQDFISIQQQHLQQEEQSQRNSYRIQLSEEKAQRSSIEAESLRREVDLLRTENGRIQEALRSTIRSLHVQGPTKTEVYMQTSRSQTQTQHTRSTQERESNPLLQLNTVIAPHEFSAFKTFSSQRSSNGY